MEYLRFSPVSLVVAALFAACSPAVPSGEDVRAEVERRLVAEANDCMQMAALEKTNGYEAPQMRNIYIVQFNAELEFLKDCKWRVESMSAGKHDSFQTSETDAQARKRGGIWAEFRNSFENLGDSYSEGTRVQISGEQGFLKTEKGFQPAPDVLSMTETRRIRGNEEARRITFARMFSLDSAYSKWHEAAYRAQGQPDQMKGLSDYAKEKYGGDTQAALQGEFVPRFLKSLPEKDGWDHPLEYFFHAGRTLYVRSPGSDGVFDAELPSTPYLDVELHADDAYEKDLLYQPGQHGGLIRGPECAYDWEDRCVFP